MGVLRLWMLVFCVALVVGCSRERPAVPVKQAASPAAEAVKSGLKEIADSGQIGSGMLTIRENLEKLKSTDPAKADALLKELDKLSAMSDPGAIRAKAKQMMDQL